VNWALGIGHWALGIAAIAIPHQLPTPLFLLFLCALCALCGSKKKEISGREKRFLDIFTQK